MLFGFSNDKELIKKANDKKIELQLENSKCYVDRHSELDFSTFYPLSCPVLIPSAHLWRHKSKGAMQNTQQKVGMEKKSNQMKSKYLQIEKSL